MLYLTRIIVILTWIIVGKGDERMPLYNRLKEHRARLGVNQQEMGALAGNLTFTKKFFCTISFYYVLHF